MDKSNRDNTIKIKINGENQSFQEQSQKKENVPKAKILPVEPDYEDQDGYKETAAAQESTDESFDWIIPESSDQDIVEYKIASTSSQKQKKSPKKKIVAFSPKRNGGVIKSILLTAVFAILIGTSFGVLMLKLVLTDNSKPAVTEPVSVDKGTGKDPEKSPGNSTSVVLGAQTLYVVQAGVFSTKDTAKDAVTQAKGKDAPAQAVAMNEKEHVFIGVAESIESAKQFAGYYKESGFEDPFGKQISVPEKTVTDINENEKAFLEKSFTVFQELSKVTSSGITTTVVSDEAIKGLEGQLKADKLENEKVKNLQTELTGALDKVKKKEKESLIEAQQHLLNFLAVYYSL